MFGHFSNTCHNKICFNCGNVGHEASSCPAPPLCNFCKEEGHLSRDCRYSWVSPTIRGQPTDESAPVNVDEKHVLRIHSDGPTNRTSLMLMTTRLSNSLSPRPYHRPPSNPLRWLALTHPWLLQSLLLLQFLPWLPLTHVLLLLQFLQLPLHLLLKHLHYSTHLNRHLTRNPLTLHPLIPLPPSQSLFWIPRVLSSLQLMIIQLILHQPVFRLLLHALKYLAVPLPQCLNPWLPLLYLNLPRLLSFLVDHGNPLNNNLLFDLIEKSDCDICFVQETLVSSDVKINALSRRWLGRSFWSPAIGMGGCCFFDLA